MAVTYYRVLVAEDGPRGWSAVFPDLPGCATCGETRNDALQSAMQAAAVWVEATTEHGESVPEPASVDAPLPAWMEEDAEVAWRDQQRVLLPVDTSGRRTMAQRTASKGASAAPEEAAKKVAGPWIPGPSQADGPGNHRRRAPKARPR